MMVKTPVKSTEQQPVFRFISGHRALDFLATFADRHGEGVERLREPTDLESWLLAAGLSATAAPSARDLQDARALREVINRLARASIAKEAGGRADVAGLNEWAARSQLTPQLDREFQRSWRSPDPVPAALALIAREAVELLSGPERGLIRECAAPACSRLYLDRSRGRRRRWCEMQRCGSHAKMSGYRQRQAARRDSDPAPGSSTAQPSRRTTPAQ
jgi:predicted RNA-binding Zn ribbon-like protein